MPDWTGSGSRWYHKPVIGVNSIESLALGLGAFKQNNPASATWPSANRAIFVPLTLNGPYNVTKVWWLNGGTASGNLDCGVYSDDGALLLNAGSTAQSGTNVLQSVALGSAVLLSPGNYYMALAASSGTATVLAQTTAARVLATLGCSQQALGGLPLPNSFTLASLASAFLPSFGIANASVI